MIWDAVPTLFKKGEEPKPIELPPDLLKDAVLIDTGSPNETTAELVQWISDRKDECEDALERIGKCTERLLEGEEIGSILNDHCQAQIELGVIPREVQELIKKIVQEKGVAKALGAGARSGGGGIVLALHKDKNLIESIAADHGYFIVS